MLLRRILRELVKMAELGNSGAVWCCMVLYGAVWCCMVLYMGDLSAKSDPHSWLLFPPVN
jgi:hypothetical protein